MCVAALAGDTKQARLLNEQLAPLHQALFLESNPIPVKWALHSMGLINAGIRLPLTVLSAERQPTLRQAMQQAGII
jgi:4-hydroxy-tetrahydrodipicolinate synthase